MCGAAADSRCDPGADPAPVRPAAPPGATGVAPPDGSCAHAPHRAAAREDPMIDLAYVLATLAFFALAWAYARACDRI